MLHYGTSNGTQYFLVHSAHALSPRDRAGTLETFLQQESGVDEDAILAYLPDGRRLRNENVRDLAGAEDQVRYSSGLVHVQHSDNLYTL